MNEYDTWYECNCITTLTALSTSLLVATGKAIYGILYEIKSRISVATIHVVTVSVS